MVQRKASKAHKQMQTGNTVSLFEKEKIYDSKLDKKT